MRERRGGVYGPYQQRRKWRVDVVSATGQRTARLYETEGEARAVIREIEKTLGIESGILAQKALDEYELWMKSKGNKPGSIEDTVYRVRRVLGDAWLRRPLRAMSPAQARARYEAIAGELAVDTHRNMLAETKTWAAWCVGRGHIRVSPFASVEGIGRRKKGKEQLTNDEGRALLAACVGRGVYSEAGRIAVAMAVTMGLRAGEIVSRAVRDLDDGGRLLRIPCSKTPAGRRTLEVPDFLAHHLLRFAAGRSPFEPLLGGPHGTSWVRKWAKKVAAEAGVSYVCPHGLRGTFATSAIGAALPHVVASAMGHANSAITTEVYAAPGAAARADHGRRLAIMKGGKTG